jgi:hypothetical protein
MSQLQICHKCDRRQQHCHGPCACLAGPESVDIIIRAESGFCPLGKFSNPLPTTPTTSRTAPVNLWRVLHAHAMSNPDLPSESLWLFNWAAKIPCGECAQHWRTWVAANPPDLSSHENYFKWTWLAHQAVNEKLGRPGITLAEALLFYSTLSIDQR